MNHRRKEYWQKAQSKGKLRFILVNGILFWALPLGIFLFILFRAYDYFFDYASLQSSNKHVIVKLIVRSLTLIIGGYIYGLLTWNKMEKQFSQNNLENK